MSKQNHIDPSPETLANRKAGMDMLRERAMRGDTLALLALNMDALAQPYYIPECVDYADDDDGWDDIRPY